MRLATWNIGSALGKDAIESIDYIVDCVEKSSIDVLCLQEVITSGENIDFVSELQKRLSYKFCKIYELSSAHLGDDAMMGVVILSKYNIVASEKIELPNPDICYIKNGKEIRSDNKGFLSVEILYKGKHIKVVTGHMLPFHSLGSDSWEYRNLYKTMYSRVKSFCEDVPYVLCGDFNSSKLKKVIKNIYIDMDSVFDKPTRYNGKQNDYIFVSKDWISKSYRIDMNEYDHFLCICEIELKTDNVLNILHLSDLHYLSNDYAIDEKTRLSKVRESDSRKELFTSKLKSITEKIDYVIVSGDITTAGRKEGFEQFSKFVRTMQEKNIFPPSNHFIVVPGNHDVGNNNRWEVFSKVLDGNCIRPWLEEIDKDIHELTDIFSNYFENETEDFFGVIENKKTSEKIHFPFILDMNRHIFIYAFNSSSISRTKIVLDKSDEDFIDKLNAKSNLNKDTRRVLDILEKELRIDPARVDPQEIVLFSEIMKIIESENKIDLSTFHKIAVLHHHTTTISCAQEIKKFDNIINAGILKNTLSDKNFQMILHGHKHYADIFYDTTIANHKKILVISGGTVFGYPNGKENGFFLHTINGNILKSQYFYLDEKKESDTIVTKLSGDMDIKKEGLTLAEIYKEVESRVVQHINRETIEGKEYIGWSKNILDRRVGVISSVYGILILEMLNSNNKYYIHKKEELIQSLWNFRHTGGGWGAVSQITECGAPEATAWVVLALFKVNSPLYREGLSDLYYILERMSENINSNFTLGLIINILCEVDPDSKFIPQYCEKLLNNAIKQDGKIEYWCVKCNTNYIQKIEPSIVHTACAIIALYNCQEKGIISRNLQIELERTREILLNKDLWKNTHEAISIQMGSKEDSLIVEYYTIAWVLKAILLMDNFVDFAIIQDAVDIILNDYDCREGYWDYEGSPYIWTIYDALTALEAYFLKK